MSNNVLTGTPTPLLVAASTWGWERVDGPFALDLDLSGEFKNSKDEIHKFNTVSFDVSDDIDVHLDFGEITRALLSTAQYPKLMKDQVFAISGILVDKGSNKITVVGNVLRRIEK